MATSLTGQAQAALIRLHEQAKRTTDDFTLERIDRALDEIVRLNSTNPPAWQVRSAMANASKVITARRQTVIAWPAAESDPNAAGPGGQEEGVIDLRAWLDVTRHLSKRQRTLLILLANDLDAADIAALRHVPGVRVREQISRTRRAARAAYDQDMNAA